MQNSEKFATFFAQFCVRNGKISGALRHLQDAMKKFTDAGRKRQERNWHVFRKGEGKNGIFGNRERD